MSALLSQKLNKNILVGYTAVHAFFTQIYDKTKSKLPEITQNKPNIKLQQMPRILDAEATLKDIENIDKIPPETDIIKWVIKNKE